MLLRRAFRRSIARPIHYVPTAEGFAAAVRAGQRGRGMELRLSNGRTATVVKGDQLRMVLGHAYPSAA